MDEERIDTAEEASQEPLAEVDAEVQEANGLLDDVAASDDGPEDVDAGPVAARPSLADVPDDELLSHLQERGLDGRIRQSERDRFRVEQEREAGKKENVAKAIERTITELGIEVDDQRKQRLGYLYELAKGNAAHDLANEFPRALMAQYDLPAEVREKAIGAREKGDLDGYVTTLIDGAVSERVKAAEADFEKRVTAETNKRLAAEMKARGIEARPKNQSGPAVPRGGSGAGGITQAELDAMPTEVFMAKTPEERLRLIQEAKQNAARPMANSR